MAYRKQYPATETGRSPKIILTAAAARPITPPRRRETTPASSMDSAVAGIESAARDRSASVSPAAGQDSSPGGSS